MLAVKGTRVRWNGYKLHVELEITVDSKIPTSDSHHLAEKVRHNLFHSHPRLAQVNVHFDPLEQYNENFHALTAYHSY